MTGCAPHEYYVERMLRTFARHWPSETGLIVYAEQDMAIPRGELRFYGDVSDCVAFLGRTKDDPRANGKLVRQEWKADERANGYSYKWDAHKWGRVPLIVRDAARRLGEGILLWMDADTVTFRDVPPDFIERDVLPPGKDVSFLGRGDKPPEIGFQGYRLPGALPFIETWADYYSSDSFLKMGQSHSAYLFGEALKVSDVNKHDMTPGGRAHTWMRSPLVRYFDHLKGKRKQLGYSSEHPEKHLVRAA